MTDKCCYQCPKRALGCRTECPEWQAHEQAKAERYAARKAIADLAYTNRRKAASHALWLRDYKRGRT